MGGKKYTIKLESTQGLGFPCPCVVMRYTHILFIKSNFEVILLRRNLTTSATAVFVAAYHNCIYILANSILWDLPKSSTQEYIFLELHLSSQFGRVVLLHRYKEGIGAGACSAAFARIRRRSKIQTAGIAVSPNKTQRIIFKYYPNFIT